MVHEITVWDDVDDGEGCKLIMLMKTTLIELILFNYFFNYRVFL